MSRTAEEWGRIAVSLPGWRWMPGMRWLLPAHATEPRAGRVYDETQAAWWNDPRSDVEGDSLPDPDDPATAGCLLELLGSRCLVRILPREGRALSEIVIPGGLTLDGRPHRINGHDLGRACIAAAEALGRWPGGEG